MIELDRVFEEVRNHQTLRPRMNQRWVETQGRIHAVNETAKATAKRVLPPAIKMAVNKVLRNGGVEMVLELAVEFLPKDVEAEPALAGLRGDLTTALRNYRAKLS